MKENEAILGPEKLRDMLGLKGAFGKFVAKMIIKALEIDKVNTLRPKFAGESAPDFARDVIKEIGARYEVPREQMDRIPAEGAFVTISNHPIGSIDGLILCDLVGHRRPDYKLMTTYMLAMIPELKDSFLPVDNFSGEMVSRNVESIKASRDLLKEGGCMGFFPAGEVSTYQEKAEDRTAIGDKPVIEDIPWSFTITKLIKRAAVPVIPIYFDAVNSSSFYRLGKIHPRLRTIRLVHELFNKRGKLIKVRIGQPILPAEVAGMDARTLGSYLRSRTYALEAQCQEDLHSFDTDSTFQLQESIDNNIPLFYRSLMVHFMQQHGLQSDHAQLIKGKYPFQTDFLRVNPDELMVNCKTADDLDSLLQKLSDGKYHLPV